MLYSLLLFQNLMKFRASNDVKQVIFQSKLLQGLKMKNILRRKTTIKVIMSTSDAEAELLEMHVLELQAGSQLVNKKADFNKMYPILETDAFHIKDENKRLILIIAKPYDMNVREKFWTFIEDNNIALLLRLTISHLDEFNFHIFCYKIFYNGFSEIDRLKIGLTIGDFERQGLLQISKFYQGFEYDQNFFPEYVFAFQKDKLLFLINYVINTRPIIFNKKPSALEDVFIKIKNKIYIYFDDADYGVTFSNRFHYEDDDSELTTDTKESYDICSPNPCLNDGICSLNTQNSQMLKPYKCECSPGFAGVSCESKISCKNCELNNCHENGVCTKCLVGWSGKSCSEISCYKIQMCLNGGYCRLENRRRTCVCPEFASGDFCENIEFEKCDTKNTSFQKCVNCAENHSGSNCNEISCSRYDICLNGGICTKSNDETSCLCSKGFSGKRCQNIDCSNCKTGLCNKNNECDDCKDGFNGQLCDNKSCTKECLDGATCVSVEDQEFCQCLSIKNGSFCIKKQSNLIYNVTWFRWILIFILALHVYLYIEHFFI